MKKAVICDLDQVDTTFSSLEGVLDCLPPGLQALEH